MRGGAKPFGIMRTETTFHRCQKTREKPGLEDSVLKIQSCTYLSVRFSSLHLFPQDLQVTEWSHCISPGLLMPRLSLETEMHIYLIDITAIWDFALASESIL